MVWFKESGENKLCLSNDTRWNIIRDCLNSYIQAWPTLIEIAEDYRSEMPKGFYESVTNLNLKRDVKDYLKLLNAVSEALDRIQHKSQILSKYASTYPLSFQVFWTAKMDSLSRRNKPGTVQVGAPLEV